MKKQEGDNSKEVLLEGRDMKRGDTQDQTTSRKVTNKVIDIMQ